MITKRKKLKLGTFYHVQWVDAIFHWEEAPEDIGSHCTPQGTLVKVSDLGIRIAWETGLEAGSYRFLFDIPWGCIVSLSVNPQE